MDFSSLSLSIFKEINQLRTDPQSYISILESYRTCYDGFVLQVATQQMETVEGGAAVGEAISFLKDAATLKELKQYTFLEECAKAHLSELSRSEVLLHKSIQGKDPSLRLEKYCEWAGKFSQIIETGCISGKQLICALLVDDGIKDRMNRNLLFDVAFKYCGVATELIEGQGVVAELLLVEEVGEPGTVFESKSSISKESTEKKILFEERSKKGIQRHYWNEQGFVEIEQFEEE